MSDVDCMKRINAQMNYMEKRNKILRSINESGSGSLIEFNASNQTIEDMVLSFENLYLKYQQS